MPKLDYLAQITNLVKNGFFPSLSKILIYLLKQDFPILIGVVDIWLELRVIDLINCV
ncbi:MAG: hypothetical protein JW991_03095 [Candidatus Pacebacteria bacterium]|nr:hypothetical protein [Candidatus Paceibacterota bacterium]